MKRAKKVMCAAVFTALVPWHAVAFENISLALSAEQQACYSLAMVGMDSVINARLGVPPEHALDLTNQPVGSDTYDMTALKTILDAYLWRDTPHTYAIKVFYGCAAESVYRKQAKAD